MTEFALWFSTFALALSLTERFGLMNARTIALRAEILWLRILLGAKRLGLRP